MHVRATGWMLSRYHVRGLNTTPANLLKAVKHYSQAEARPTSYDASRLPARHIPAMSVSFAVFLRLNGLGRYGFNYGSCRARYPDQCPDDNFNPIRPTTINDALTMRAAVSASPMTAMPKINAPTAPMPVQTA